MQTLVLCDDYWHPAHVPRAGLAPLGGSEFTFDWIEDARDWSPERMAAYPLVILTKSNNVSAADQTPWMTDDAQAAFAEYVRKGHGLLAIHSGTASYAEKPVFARPVGRRLHAPPQAVPGHRCSPWREIRCAPGASRSRCKTSTISWRWMIRRPKCT